MNVCFLHTRSERGIKELIHEKGLEQSPIYSKCLIIVQLLVNDLYYAIKIMQYYNKIITSDNVSLILIPVSWLLWIPWQLSW